MAIWTRVLNYPFSQLVESAQELKWLPAGLSAGPELGSRKWTDMWSAGQSVAQADSIKPAGEIIQEMMKDYFKTVSSLQSTITTE